MSTAPNAETQGTMRVVLLALVPGVCVSTLFFGWGVLANLLTVFSACIGFEALAQRLRQRPIAYDLSVMLTSVLLALSLPPGGPWWLAITGGGITILLGKHLYDGRLFNPAMLGFVALLVCFPAQMTDWHTAQPLWASGVDAVSSATPLDQVRAQLRLQHTFSEITSQLPQASAWTCISLAYLLGGIYLLWRRIIRWQIPVTLLSGLILPALLYWAMDSDRYASPLFHALTGASMLGAFFIATDPATAARTPWGRLIYGAGVGLLMFVIRVWGRYPDGLGFAVLLMNLCAPTIDKMFVYPMQLPQAQKSYMMAAAGLLAALVAILSTLLIVPYQMTWGRLLVNRQTLNAQLNELLHSSTYDNKLARDTMQVSDPLLAQSRPITVYRVRRQGTVLEAVFTVVAPDGYNGDIELLVGIKADGTLTGVRARTYQETRDLGDKIDLANSSWILAFSGKSLAAPIPEHWRVKKDGGDFDQFSGATVTPRAVVKAVHGTLEYAAKHHDAIFMPAPMKQEN